MPLQQQTFYQVRHIIAICKKQKNTDVSTYLPIWKRTTYKAGRKEVEEKYIVVFCFEIDYIAMQIVLRWTRKRDEPVRLNIGTYFS